MEGVEAAAPMEIPTSESGSLIDDNQDTDDGQEKTSTSPIQAVAKLEIADLLVKLLLTPY